MKQQQQTTSNNPVKDEGEKMDVYFSVFNCHINNAEKRAIEDFKVKYSETLLQKHIMPIFSQGIMSIFDKKPNKYTKYFVESIQKYVNEESAPSTIPVKEDEGQQEGKHTKGKLQFINNNGYLNIQSDNGEYVISDWDINEDKSVGIFVNREKEIANFERIVEAWNEIDKLKEDNKKLREAIEYYQKGVNHFFNCIDFGKSFLDAEAITFMNEHGIKFSKALNKQP